MNEDPLLGSLVPQDIDLDYTSDYSPSSGNTNLPEFDLDIKSATPMNLELMGGGNSQVDPYDQLDQQLISSSNKLSNPNDVYQPIEFNSKDSNFWSFYNTFGEDKYKTLGFEFDKNNDDLYSRNLDKLDKLGLALGNAWALTKETYVEAWKNEGAFWKNLVSGEFSKALSLEQDPVELQRLYDVSKEISSRHYTPMSLEEQNGEYGFGKFSQTLGQFGFTAGTILQVVTQTAAEAAVAYLAAIPSGGASIAGAAVSSANAVKRLFTVGKLLKDLKKMDTAVSAGNGLRKLYKVATDGKGAMGGFNNFYRLSKELTAAQTEANFEAAQSYGELLESMYADSIAKEGFLSEERNAEMQKLALEGATYNGFANTVMLMGMNRINMGGIFRGGFGAQGRALKEFEGVAEQLVKTKTGWKAAADVGFFTKEGAKQFGKSSGKWLLNSGFEGVQEVTQGASAEYFNELYRSKYNHESIDPVKTLGASLGAHILSKQAAEEFFSGFIIGAPGSMMSYAVDKGINLIQGTDTKGQKEAVRSMADNLNKYENDPLRIFRPEVANINTQQAIGLAMDEAVRNGNVYAYKNLQRESFHEMVMTGIQTGKLDWMLSNIEDTLDSLSDEDFQATFGMAKSEGSEKTARSYFEDLQTVAKNINKEYGKAKEKFANPYANFSKVANDPIKLTEQKLQYRAWEAAVTDYVFNKDIVRDIKERMASILGDISQVAGGTATDSVFTLTSPTSVARERVLLREEISNLRSDTSREGKKLLLQKERELAVLDKWVETDPKDTDENQIIFTDYLNIRQRYFGAEELSYDQMDQSFKGFYDFTRLQKDNERTIANISLLSSPDNFQDYFNRHFVAHKKFFEEETKRRQDLMMQYIKVTDYLEDPEFQAFLGADFDKYNAQIDQAITNTDYELGTSVYTEIIEKHRQFEENKNTDNQALINSVVEKIINGDELTDEDLQIQANFPAEIEAELLKRRDSSEEDADTSPEGIMKAWMDQNLDYVSQFEIGAEDFLETFDKITARTDFYAHSLMGNPLKALTTILGIFNDGVTSPLPSEFIDMPSNGPFMIISKSGENINTVDDIGVILLNEMLPDSLVESLKEVLPSSIMVAKYSDIDQVIDHLISLNGSDSLSYNDIFDVSGVNNDEVNDETLNDILSEKSSTENPILESSNEEEIVDDLFETLNTCNK